MITVDNLTKNFGSQLLFEGVTFTINPRERLGLVGRNGHGKTTLFRLIVGDDLPSEGTIAIPKQYRIGYVRQALEFTEDTVLKEGSKGLSEREKQDTWKVEKVLAGLGFTNEDMQRAPKEFSGGHQVRLNLAKVLVSEPDLLLLDEPTNYLDITSIRWIEQFLLNWPHELMLITHDRSFMDKIVTHTLGIHRRNIRKIPGNTEKFYSQIALEEEIHEKTRLRDERRRKDIEDYISRFRAKARLASLVQSRIKTLAKTEKKEKLEHMKTLDFSFRSKPQYSKCAMEVDSISFWYDTKVPLVRNLSFALGKEDCICVVGRNGKGKTTLLKLLAGVLQPLEGKVNLSHSTTIGLFEQTNVSSLVDSRTVEEEILNASQEIDRQTARNICGAMMFEGDDALKKIEVISGGEKSRVMLGKMLVTPANLLLLDEPTNHLDMESCDALLAAIDNFDGAVIIVTHNEMFLHALAQRLIVFDDNKCFLFEGSYQEFLDKTGWKEERPAPSRNTKAISTDIKPGDKVKKKELKRRRSDIITQRGREIKPIERRISLIEDEIESHEKNLKQCHELLEEASQAMDGPRIVELSQSIHKSEVAINKLFDELDMHTRNLEEKKTQYEEMLHLEEEEPI
ncbi:MAG: ABC-F family ATP-binding cassette domain-containing protein [Chloroflexota bacterium]|nr:ABC-F family ATP-binding cassette domain-containing protein [Chloroflexota bacterium]